jgi:hypothetical protein
MDFRMTGSLRTVVVSPKGLRSWGSRCTADSTTMSTTTATIAATIPPARPVPGRRGITIRTSRGSRLSVVSRVVSVNLFISRSVTSEVR